MNESTQDVLVLVDGDAAVAGPVAVAARCGAPVLTGATDVSATADAVEVRRDVHGGIAVRTERVTGGPAVVTVAPGGVAAPAAPVAVEEVAAPVPPAAVRVREERASGRASVDLGGARVVVGIGRGLKAREDLALVERLAAALGAEVACSRPLAEGHDWLTKDRYIGISGQHVAPDLYVAAGISGQVQHMVGVAGAKVVVAINSDADAPVFAQCDHGVVGDLYTVLPALAAALEA